MGGKTYHCLSINSGVQGIMDLAKASAAVTTAIPNSLDEMIRGDYDQLLRLAEIYLAPRSSTKLSCAWETSRIPRGKTARIFWGFSRAPCARP
jgi:hypothetical protein